MRLEPREEARLLQKTEQPTILIVDDEAIIRDLCARALKDFRILQAENRGLVMMFARTTWMVGLPYCF